jgi:hypothetical protein
MRQSSTAGQSIAVPHIAPHCGGSAAQRPSALQVKATSLAMPQPMSVQVGLHGSPQARFAHGSPPPHPGQLVVQRPIEHSVFGHDVVPSAHIWHGASTTGHSMSVVHSVAQVG